MKSAMHFGRCLLATLLFAVSMVTPRMSSSQAAYRA